MSRAICGICMCPYGDAGDCACEVGGASENDCGSGANCCYQASRIETLEEINHGLVVALRDLLGAVSVRIDDPRVKLFDSARAALAKAGGYT